MNSSSRVRMAGFCAIVFVVGLGCAGPGPKLFPVGPVATTELPGGRAIQWFDVDGDGRGDFGEELGETGRIERLLYGPDPATARDVVLADISPGEVRHIVLMLDSVPYKMVAEAWRQGRLRYCDPPSRLVSPFPVMTDLSFSEFFGTSPSPGVEASYYDGNRLTDGYDVYAEGGNVGWQRFVDYHMNPVAHAPTYLRPYPWFNHELRQIQDLFTRSRSPMTVGYLVGTSAVGAKYGRTGHQAGLVALDRYCHWLLYASCGRARFTLMSDHGHSFYDSKRIPLADNLAELGYRVGKRLQRPGDVVVPEFGMVSCAAIYTHTPARVARDCVGIEGVELAMYRSGEDEITLLGREGTATITRGPTGFRYAPVVGDPLELIPVIHALGDRGRVDAQGFVEDAVLFDATLETEFPDAVYRIWRAFDGLVEHTPDVLLSTEEGYHAGSALMTSLIGLIGVHGNLRPGSTDGFVMTSAGRLPASVRMEDVRAELRSLGVEVPGGDLVTPAGAMRSATGTRPN